jgi:hypothetical protein
MPSPKEGVPSPRMMFLAQGRLVAAPEATGSGVHAACHHNARHRRLACASAHLGSHWIKPPRWPAGPPGSEPTHAMPVHDTERNLCASERLRAMLPAWHCSARRISDTSRQGCSPLATIRNQPSGLINTHHMHNLLSAQLLSTHANARTHARIH